MVPPIAGSTSEPASAVDPSGMPGALTAKAQSMSSAVSGLEARLAKGGGTPADWELLAKSYEFLGLPDQASRARRHELADSSATSTAAAPRATSGRAVTGEVTLAVPLRAKAASGATLFIVAKSVDSPGAPVAVFRGTVRGFAGEVHAR